MKASIRVPILILAIACMTIGTVGCSDPNSDAKRRVATMEKQLNFKSFGDIECRRIIDPKFGSSSPYTVVVAIGGIHKDDAVDLLNSVGYSGTATDDDGGVWNASGSRHVILGLHGPSESGDSLDFGGKPCKVPKTGLTVFELSNQ